MIFDSWLIRKDENDSLNTTVYHVCHVSMVIQLTDFWNTNCLLKISLIHGIIGSGPTHRGRKEIWDGGSKIGVWRTEVPQRGPRAEPVPTLEVGRYCLHWDLYNIQFLTQTICDIDIDIIYCNALWPAYIFDYHHQSSQCYFLTSVSCVTRCNDDHITSIQSIHVVISEMPNNFTCNCLSLN